MGSVERRYRYVYKPLVFVACATPFVLLLLGAFALFGRGLGIDPVRTLLHTLGKTALNMLLITLAVTPLRQLLHAPQLIRLRRMLGLFAFFYALLHFVVYAVLDRGLDWANVLEDLVERPYITIGFIALLALLPLAVTSTNGMMRRLGRRWQTLHWLIYPIAVLGVWHFWWQVKKDISEPLLYAGMLGVLLLYRLLRGPVRRALTSKSVSATTPERI
jgi:sulfoxide reductase heme-binding subunit YedZ